MKQNVKYKIRGHETFCIREGWLTKGLHAVEANPKVFGKSIGADALGVGTNMVKAIKYWLKATGLAEDKATKGMFLTEFGELVYKFDPYFEDNFTLWCTHMNIVANLELATSWHLFFSEFGLEEFKREDVEDFLTVALEKYTRKEDLSARSIKEDGNVLLQMYAKNVADEKNAIDPEDKLNSPLEKLGLMRKNNHNYKRMQPDLATFPEEAILYLLHCLWSDKVAFNLDELYYDKLGVRKVLGLSMSAYQECLSMLERKDYIHVSRTAGLDTVYTKFTKEVENEKKVQKQVQLGKEVIVKKYYESRI